MDLDKLADLAATVLRDDGRLSSQEMGRIREASKGLLLDSNVDQFLTTLRDGKLNLAEYRSLPLRECEQHEFVGPRALRCAFPGFVRLFLQKAPTAADRDLKLALDLASRYGLEITGLSTAQLEELSKAVASIPPKLLSRDFIAPSGRREHQSITITVLDKDSFKKSCSDYDVETFCEESRTAFAHPSLGWIAVQEGKWSVGVFVYALTLRYLSSESARVQADKKGSQALFARHGLPPGEKPSFVHIKNNPRIGTIRLLQYPFVGGMSFTAPAGSREGQAIKERLKKLGKGYENNGTEIRFPLSHLFDEDCDNCLKASHLGLSPAEFRQLQDYFRVVIRQQRLLGEAEMVERWWKVTGDKLWGTSDHFAAPLCRFSKTYFARFQLLREFGLVPEERYQQVLALARKNPRSEQEQCKRTGKPCGAQFDEQKFNGSAGMVTKHSFSKGVHSLPDAAQEDIAAMVWLVYDNPEHLAWIIQGEVSKLPQPVPPRPIPGRPNFK